MFLLEKQRGSFQLIVLPSAVDIFKEQASSVCPCLAVIQIPSSRCTGNLSTWPFLFFVSSLTLLLR